MIHLFVEYLTCKVTEHYGLAICRRRQLSYKIGIWCGNLVFRKASSKRRYVYQIVGIIDYDGRIDNIVFCSWHHDVQLVALLQHILQISMVAKSIAVVGFAIINLLLQARFAISSHYKVVVPTVYHHSHHGSHAVKWTIIGICYIGETAV